MEYEVQGSMYLLQLSSSKYRAALEVTPKKGKGTFSEDLVLYETWKRYDIGYTYHGSNSAATEYCVVNMLYRTIYRLMLRLRGSLDV